MADKDILYGCVHQFIDRGLINIRATNNGECPICCEDFIPADEPVKIKACGHRFHRQCLLRWVEGEKCNTCPTCRHKLFANPATEEEINTVIDEIMHGIEIMLDPLCTMSHEDVDQVMMSLPDSTVRAFNNIHDLVRNGQRVRREYLRRQATAACRRNVALPNTISDSDNLLADLMATSGIDDEETASNDSSTPITMGSEISENEMPEVMRTLAGAARKASAATNPTEHTGGH